MVERTVIAAEELLVDPEHSGRLGSARVGDEEPERAFRIGHFNGVEERLDLSCGGIHDLEPVGTAKADTGFKEMDGEGLGGDIALLSNKGKELDG